MKKIEKTIFDKLKFGEKNRKNNFQKNVKKRKIFFEKIQLLLHPPKNRKMIF